MINTELAYDIASAINEVRQDIDIQEPSAGARLDTLNVAATNIAAVLYPHNCLTQNCTRRAFLLTAGVHGG